MGWITPAEYKYFLNDPRFGNIFVRDAHQEPREDPDAVPPSSTVAGLRQHLDTQIFDPDKLQLTEFEIAGYRLAKIPKLPGQIARKKKDQKVYIEYIYAHKYDPETKQNRNRKVIIGESVEGDYRGMMVLEGDRGTAG